MFTIDQIKLAHSKVKSGADFPNYIQDLYKLGIIYYTTYVNDGHTDYLGKNNFIVSTASGAKKRFIADISDGNQFKIDLRAHQAGKTDYDTFCKDCAKSGIEKWVVDLVKMTCTYYDNAGSSILEEQIPTV